MQQQEICNHNNEIQLLQKNLTDQILNNALQAQQFLIETQMAHVFRDSIQDIPWIKSKSFSAHGGAANYSLLYILFRVLHDVRPTSIIEFGMGQTSKLTTQYTAYGNKSAQLLLVEDSQKWINLFKKDLPTSKRIKILNLPIQKIRCHHAITTHYKDLRKNIGDTLFDFIIVDGPAGQDRYSRCNVLELLGDNLAENFVIIIDDYDRPGEQETGNEVMNQLDLRKISFVSAIYRGTKTQLLICSPDYAFLKTI